MNTVSLARTISRAERKNCNINETDPYTAITVNLYEKINTLGNFKEKTLI